MRNPRKARQIRRTAASEAPTAAMSAAEYWSGEIITGLPAEVEVSCWPVVTVTEGDDLGISEPVVFVCVAIVVVVNEEGVVLGVVGFMVPEPGDSPASVVTIFVVLLAVGSVLDVDGLVVTEPGGVKEMGTVIVVILLVIEPVPVPGRAVVVVLESGGPTEGRRVTLVVLLVVIAVPVCGDLVV